MTDAENDYKDMRRFQQQFIDADQALRAITERLNEMDTRFAIAFEALEKIAAVTYGTELCNTEEENNKILAEHFFWHQNIARDAIKHLRATGSEPESK
jgi:hypothetical protein